MQAQQREPFWGAARPLRLALGAIILIFVLVDVLSFFSARRVQAANKALFENVLATTTLVTRIRHDLDEDRRLVDAHILEREAASMERVDAEIAAVDGDLEQAASAYERLASSPQERAQWEQVEARLPNLRRAMDQVLAMSRENRDDDARKDLLAAEGKFDEIDSLTAGLIDDNRLEAVRTALAIRAREHASMTLNLVLVAAGIALALMIALGITRFLSRRHREVEQIGRQLEERNRELDAFAGRVAHDLRGPLSTVSLAASRLAQCAPREEGTSSVLHRGVARMDRLIIDLLTLSRIDAQAPDLTCDPSKVAAVVGSDTRSQLESADGTLDVDVEAALVRCGEGLLQQALGNLVENALKYRRADVAPTITLRGASMGEHYELRVSDNGRGMSDADARRAFEPFYRAQHSQETPGTGLGLSIVRRIVTSSGGTVSVSSALGQGTTFTLRLETQRNPSVVHAGSPTRSLTATSRPR